MAEVRTRRARFVVALAILTGWYISICAWAGFVTDGFFGALRIGGIALITAILLWAIVGGLVLLVGWVAKGEPRG